MKILDKYFIKNRKNHYCFKYSKKYLRKIEEEEKWDKINKIMKYLDYPWSLKVFLFRNEKRKFSIIAYINYCRLGNLKHFQYKDSKIWEDMLL